MTVVAVLPCPEGATPPSYTVSGSVVVVPLVLDKYPDILLILTVI